MPHAAGPFITVLVPAMPLDAGIVMDLIPLFGVIEAEWTSVYEGH
jgi:hypothetical protein